METATDKKTEVLKKIKRSDWMEEGIGLFGEDPRFWRFVCPNCGNVQTIADFLELRKFGIDIKDAQGAYFNCIGRYDTRIPPHEIGTLTDPKKPCDYTLGGLFWLGETIVIDDENNEHPVFEFDRSSESEENEEKKGA